jgi:hypothetical protein
VSSEWRFAVRRRARFVRVVLVWLVLVAMTGVLLLSGYELG